MCYVRSVEPVIAILPAHVIDQIAAGEVIERPSSVVKELVDNALDAGAKMITIEAQLGGRSLVRVTDDGCGMAPADARLALARHATSKLTKLDDLWGIATMGFRGEALPSIASVSRMTLTTRRQGDLAATRIAIEGGRIGPAEEVGAPVGTTIEVADLLYNVPARLKFMKGEATEASHITELVAKLAMAHPQLHVRLRHNGRIALEVPRDLDGLARARALLGARVASRLVAVHGEETGVRVTAYLAAPELAQASARGVQLFVARRPVRDRGVLHAIAMGYGELVPRGRYPVVVVMLDLPAGAVDLNVHPQKLEVRFADPAAVHAAVRHVVQSGVASAGWRAESGAGPVVMTAIASVAPPRLPFDGPATPMAQRYAAQLRNGRVNPSWQAPPATQGRLGFEATIPDSPSPRSWIAAVKAHVHAGRAADGLIEASDAQPRRGADGLLDAPLELIVPFTMDDEPDDAPASVAVEPAVAVAQGSGPVMATGFFSVLRYLGQLDLTYLVCEGDGELVLVDQHSAHERVELARLEARHTDRDVPVQKMLFPVTLDATPEQLELASRVGGLLAQAGFEVEPFGKATLAVKAVPAGIRHGDPAQLLRRLLADWAEAGAPSEAELLARVLSEIACHSVVRAGDRLSPNEAEALLRALDGVDLQTRNPHGRPVLLRLPLPEIARKIGRASCRERVLRLV